MNIINNVKSNYNNNLQFKGVNNKLKPIITMSMFTKDVRGFDAKTVSTILNIKPENVKKMTAKASINRLKFLERLSEKYNARNFTKSKVDKENPQDVIDIFQTIKKPKAEHYQLINNLDTSILNTKRIVLATQNNPKRLTFANKINNEIIDTGIAKTSRPEIIAELLESKNADAYIKDYPKYKSYLILNKDDENVIKNLDKMVETGSFNPKTYDIELANKRIFGSGSLSETPVLNKLAIQSHYTEEGNSFLNRLVKSFGVSKESLSAGNDRDILEMYKTTTPKNLNIRMSLVESFKTSQLKNIALKSKNDELSEMRKLFDRMDIDKHAKSFVKKTLVRDERLGSIKDYNDILENVSSKKLNIFYDNGRRIIRQTEKSERIKTLQNEIENPFFETDYVKNRRIYAERHGYTKPESFVSKARKYISNQFNMLRSAMTQETSIPSSKTEKVVVEKVQSTVNSIENTEVTKKAEPKVSRMISKAVKKAPNAKKLEVINGVNNIIEKKLGRKTFETQQRDYAIKATKMRLNALPEIFASIKETRAVDKAVGKKASESNKDALMLYEKINGKNKKLVNYMLKKRNADGTRMFGVKDIIAAIDNAESKIVSKKQANVITSPSDIKMYYGKLYDAKIQQYGKLDRKNK